MKINIVAYTNSKKPRIEKDLTGVLHVYVKEPAKKQKANKAIRKALAENFDVNKSAIKLTRGAKSKNKVFEIAIK